MYDLAMNFSNIKLSRDDLYKKVWEQPVSVVAKEYGISDVGLAKICRRLQVPVPGLGYWSKKQHGKPVKQIPLPPPPANTTLEVTINTYRKVAPDAKQLERATELIDAEELEANEVRVSEVLIDPDPAVARSRKLLGKAQPEADGLVHVADPECLPVTVSPQQLDRALRIMDALLKAFAVRGYAVTIRNEDQHELRVVVADEPIMFHLSEGLNKTPINAGQKKDLQMFGWKPRQEYEYSPSGTLALHVNANLWNGMRRRWSDSARRPLEKALNSFLAGIVKVAVAVRAERLDRERRDRELKDRERRRRELFIAQEREKERLAQLDREVASWHKAQEIRAYVQTARDLSLKKFGRIDPGSEMDQWITWAMAQADRHDPLVESPPSVLHEELPSAYGY
jgi:hypothetical protein